MTSSPMKYVDITSLKLHTKTDLISLKTKGAASEIPHVMMFCSNAKIMEVAQERNRPVNKPIEGINPESMRDEVDMDEMLQMIEKEFAEFSTKFEEELKNKTNNLKKIDDGKSFSNEMYHEHPLYEVERKEKWLCDGFKLPGKCYGGMTGKSKPGDHQSFACIELGCIYSLCGSCA